MAKNKKITGTLKIVIEAGKATPAPPVGTALGPKKVNIAAFCKEFNDRTKALTGPIPVDMTIYQDNSFSFITKNPPTSYLIKQAVGLKKGSQEPGRNMVGKITDAQLAEIAEIKKEEMGVLDIEAAKRIVAGTAVSMGLEVMSEN